MTEAIKTTAVDQARLEEFFGRAVTDAGAAVTVPLAVVGARLGLFAAMSVEEDLTAEQLANRAGLAERYVREWLLAMALSGYVTYAGGGSGGAEPKRTARYRLSPEQATAFTDPESPGYVVGLFQSAAAATRMVDRLTEVFSTGSGIDWHEHHDDMFEATEKLFRPVYLANLTSSWIPSLTGVEERLLRGARVADVGCGFGSSTIIMAEAYPNSTFVGVDYHAPSIATARERAEAASVGERITFRTAGAADLDGSYDFISFFDCLHDMPDPSAALRAARRALAPEGRVMLVEPMSWDTVEETLRNPMARSSAGASLLVCLPSGLSRSPGLGLGNQAGVAPVLRLAEEAGFTGARLATSSEANIIYELAP
ncbi:methyltransferase domain-containing protein [Amycolatopsis sp. NPDC023774]|uniref:class I SAM-dependent methyltransferase n=1 Tax=Amycolatopsis sp. NPDC023774 TaxID=3155015 RepID=UPI0033E0C9D8